MRRAVNFESAVSCGPNPPQALLLQRLGLTLPPDKIFVAAQYRNVPAGQMGNTFRIEAGSVYAVEAVFGDGRAPAFCCQAARW